MTDEQIIKALEHCVNERSCIGCIAYTPRGCQGIDEGTLDIIKRQKAEIAELQEILGGTAKVQSLTCARVRIEAIKEFAERLKEMPSVMNCEYEWLHTDIDNLVKEMTEQKGR